MHPMKQTIDLVESWMVKVTSYIMHTRCGRRMKETSTSCEVSYPNFFEDAKWTYAAPPPNIVNFLGYPCVISFFPRKITKNAIKLIKYSSFHRKM